MIYSKNARKFFVVTIILLMIGLIMVMSSSWPLAVQKGYSPYHYFKLQSLYAVLGLISMFIFSKIDHRYYKKYAWLIFILGIIACLLVYSPLGVTKNYARRWLNFGITDMMPSDLLKFSVIVLSAYLFDRYKSKISTIRYGFIPMVFIMGTSGIIVFKQPDLSTALVIMCTTFLLFVIAGIDLKQIFISAGIFLSFILYAIFSEGIGYSRIDRLKAFMNPLEHANNESWQLVQSLCAVSTGSVLGLGLGRSRQKYMYLSEAHNDFIYAIISEELGFIGSVSIICLYVALIVYGVRISIGIKNIFAKYMVLGLTILIGLQAFMNITVVLGLIPPTGITLPFISYGGSSLILMLSIVGVIMNIDQSHRKGII